MVDISIVWNTMRQVSAFGWFADGLARQLGNDDVEVIIVDALWTPERATQFNKIINGRFPHRHIAPMPNPYRGPHRVTRHEYFAVAGSRNTGTVLARAPYMVFVDDAGVPMPGWWPAAREAARSGIVMTGAWQKRWSMLVKDGCLVASRGALIDPRWHYGRDDRPTRIDGAHLYSGSMGAPRQIMIDLNGFDELCDGVGGEDFQLGIRIARAGIPLYYHRGMLTIESEELHRIGTGRNTYNPRLEEHDYMRRLAEFSVSERGLRTSFEAADMIVDLAYGAPSLRALGNWYSLGELDETTIGDVADRFPTHHWFDGRPLCSLSPTWSGIPG
jgi:hypothetical protein